VNDSTNQSPTPRRYWLTPDHGLHTHPNWPWALLSLPVITIIALAACGEAGREALRYQRAAVLERHEYWRLLTSHLVHGSWHHVWLNLAGLALMVALFRGTYSVLQWCGIVLFSVACIDLGFVFLMAQLQWYVGLSGVLHGLLAAGAVAWWRVEDRRLTVVLWMILLAKLAWEQWQGALPLSGDLNVIVNAHLYGAIGGMLMGVAMSMRLPPLARLPPQHT
jgi:rhomboid family GlyGly-CTERM serine protease